MEADALVGRLQDADLLRFTTAGSVDDGKSTLIGRLLHDTKTVYEDQLRAVEDASRRAGNAETDLALLTDGLRAEREQRITIDVAYRPFSTPRRRFIIADAPGHEQYTRNMVTAASTAELAVILLDAERGLTVQSRRHGFIAGLIGIRKILVAVNKMDLVDWSQDRFEELRSDYAGFITGLDGISGSTDAGGSPIDVAFIPVSALLGDNVVSGSANMPWYGGPTLLEALETAPLDASDAMRPFRLPVQYVQRPDRDYRGYSGTIASGSVAVGDTVAIYPSRYLSRVKSILTAAGDAHRAAAPEVVTLTFADDIDIGRGHLLVQHDKPPMELHEFDATLIWMDAAPLDPDVTYLLKHTTRTIRARALRVHHRIDPSTLAPLGKGELALNDIGRVRLRALQPIYADTYAANRRTGGFILIDPSTHQTAAAGLIEAAVSSRSSGHTPANLTRHVGRVTPSDRSRMLGQRPLTLWLTGLSASGKSTIAYAVEERLTRAGRACMVLDGDNMREGLNRDLGFSPEDRGENIRRVAEVARLFNEAGLIVLTSFISPYASDRQNARSIIGEDRFVETWVDAPLEECERRDPKGLYAKARAGSIPDFTGVSAPYEEPAAPDLRLDTSRRTVEELADEVWAYLESRWAFSIEQA